MGTSWRILEPKSQKVAKTLKNKRFLLVFRGPNPEIREGSGTILGHLGGILAQLGSILALSWPILDPILVQFARVLAHLGPLLAHLGADLGST